MKLLEVVFNSFDLLQENFEPAESRLLNAEKIS